ncbi:MAG: hypothetical protein K1X74_20140 [Pirellulales bacterium]|nr:hypothetical protein [Pirellulales bacterium]
MLSIRSFEVSSSIRGIGLGVILGGAMSHWGVAPIIILIVGGFVQMVGHGTRDRWFPKGRTHPQE